MACGNIVEKCVKLTLKYTEKCVNYILIFTEKCVSEYNFISLMAGFIFYTNNHESFKKKNRWIFDSMEKWFK